MKEKLKIDKQVLISGQTNLFITGTFEKYKCLNCLTRKIEYEYNYCPVCGLKIEWSGK